MNWEAGNSAKNRSKLLMCLSSVAPGRPKLRITLLAFWGNRSDQVELLDIWSAPCIFGEFPYVRNGSRRASFAGDGTSDFSNTRHDTFHCLLLCRSWLVRQASSPFCPLGFAEKKLSQKCCWCANVLSLDWTNVWEHRWILTWSLKRSLPLLLMTPEHASSSPLVDTSERLGNTHPPLFARRWSPKHPMRTKQKYESVSALWESVTVHTSRRLPRNWKLQASEKTTT